MLQVVQLSLYRFDSESKVCVKAFPAFKTRKVCDLNDHTMLYLGGYE